MSSSQPPKMRVFLYVGGVFIDGEHGPEYSIRHRKGVMVSRSIKYSKLCEKICNLLQINQTLYDIALCVRYPIEEISGTHYVLHDIEDDNDVQFVFNMFNTDVHLYITTNERRVEPQSNVDNSVFAPVMVHEAGPSHPLSLDHHNDLVMSTQGVSQLTRDEIVVICEQAIRELVANEPATVVQGISVTGDPVEPGFANVVVEDEESDEYVAEDNEPDDHYPDPTEAYSPPEFFSQVEMDSSHMNRAWAAGPSRPLYNTGDSSLREGMQFPSKKDLQVAVDRHHVVFNREYVVSGESNKRAWEIKCKLADQGCLWKLRGSLNIGNGTWEVKRLRHEHSCLNLAISQGHRHLSSRLVAREMISMLKAQPTITPDAIIANIGDKFKYKISYKVAWSAKQKAMATIYGGWRSSYENIPKWLNAVQQFNPGTVQVVEVQNPNHIYRDFYAPDLREGTFFRAFWSFAPSIEGFKHCPPVICIDATFLTGKYAGKLIMACAPDANLQIFPLAFALVERENEDNWGWFLRCIRAYVTQREDVCLISDRHAGIIAAVRNNRDWQPPMGHHRFCFKHVSANFESVFKSTVARRLFNWAGYTHQPRKCEGHLAQLFSNPKFGKEAEEWVSSMDKEKWTQSYDGGKRYGIMTTNLVECFNAVFKGVRSLPIMAVVQLSYYRTIKYFYARRQEAESSQQITPKVMNTMIAQQGKSTVAHVTKYDHRTLTFEILTLPAGVNRGGNTQVVYLQHGKCDCGGWQNNHYPCSHVMAACAHMNASPATYISDFWTYPALRLQYGGTFYPIPHPDYWVIPEDLVTCTAPEHLKRKKKGRPQTRRIHTQMDAREGHLKNRCGICREEGHSRRTCPRK